jgi:transcriptional regulator with XRE-family HTH domain
VAVVAANDWTAVGAAVRARREELGLTQVELATAANVSDSTVRVLETARRTTYRRGNLRAIARALRWPDDAIDRIRAGRPPAEDLSVVDRRPVEERLAALEAELAELREQLRSGQRT